ncbi:calcium/sodium antiporter [Amorphus orientalis]|uniref:Cation:H+ antiporter n=1 Tax=Amorphus orientalis TaxID=649198 RepID=A0AAE4AVV4_9HYPH|nr:calcium/sodium antiporter [Amorphus orientalis]MDQ0317084.1 cation:H+ antiporter [Amorphus orientalis]
MILFQILAGVAGLLIGGEFLVRGASRLAVRLGMSPLVVGVTIVGFGTSVPELVTCLEAAWRGAPGIAVGNIVGSNIANILLILGVAAALRPFACSRKAATRDGLLVIVTAIAFGLAAMTGELGRWIGGLFVAGLVLYLGWLYFSERKSGDLVDTEAAEVPDPGEVTAKPWYLDAILVVVGCAVVVIGANQLVDGSVTIARLFNISEDVIGLSLVALGTSLPELATSIVAAVRKHSEIALGNVLGSNVYNVLGIGGITALVHPVPVSLDMLTFDIPIMVGVSVVMVAMVATGARVTRIEGGVLLGAYAAYIGVLYLGIS